jgi:hypothetical protein
MYLLHCSEEHVGLLACFVVSEEDPHVLLTDSNEGLFEASVEDD